MTKQIFLDFHEINFWYKYEIFIGFVRMSNAEKDHARHDKDPEDQWSCIAHLSAEDMLKSAIIEEKKFKHSPWAGADSPLGPNLWCQQEGLITMVICCKFKNNLFICCKFKEKISLKSDFIRFFHDFIHVYSSGEGADSP